MKILFTALFLMITSLGFSQENTETNHEPTFPEKCIGVWEGTMTIHNNNVLVDTVGIQFTVARTEEEGTYTWKTEYFSEKYPGLVKDYILIVKDAEKGIYDLDEGNDIVLSMYNVADKLYSMFEVQGSYLTSETELVGDNIVFEVSSGKEINETGGVTNYSVSNVQRVVLSRVEGVNGKIDVEQVVQVQLDAYNARDIDAFLETYADDVEIYQGCELLYTGKDVMRTQYASMFEQVTDLNAELKNRIVIGNKVIDEEYVRFNGEYISAVAIYEVEKGKIAKVTFIE